MMTTSKIVLCFVMLPPLPPYLIWNLFCQYYRVGVSSELVANQCVGLINLDTLLLDSQ